MKRAGLGCAALGCAAPLLSFVILAGAGGVLVGNWGALAQPRFATGPPLAVADPAAVASIPPDFLALYQQAATRFGIEWQVLAAVGRVETIHGRIASDCRPNFAGARGPMQFLRGTFARASRMAGLTDADICDPHDAIHAAAAYLAYHGAPRDWRRALYRYNPKLSYVERVLRWAESYGYGASVVWPIDGGRITQGFGPTDFHLAPPRCYQGICHDHFHAGIDIAAPRDTPVVAIAAGTVTFAGRVSDEAVVVQIEHQPGVISSYGHLRADLQVSEGDVVVAGQPIGYVGMTGVTTGPHVHFEVHVSGQPIDPLQVLPERPSP